MRVPQTFYYGTIMDGIYFKIDNCKYFVIMDVYQFKGENQILKNRLSRLYNLDKNLKKVSVSESVSICVCKNYDLEIDLLKQMIDTIKINPQIRELYFYPDDNGNKIYNYVIKDSDLQDNWKMQLFKIYKTNRVDVYEIKQDGMNHILYIPDIETSKMCQQWFKKNKTVNAYCKYNETHNKWIPVELK